MTTMRLKFDTPRFFDYAPPNGFLPYDAPNNALFYYYLLARKAYEEIILDPLVLEGERDPEANFRQLFTSVAIAYGVKPEEMAKCWHNVDMQCHALDMPLLPDEERYRFNRIQEIRQ